MIEVIYKEEPEEPREPFAMPRNVRQIGLANGDYRIYVEDYVYTFLSSLASETEEKEGTGKAAVLTGEIRWDADMTCIFVKGALAADEMEAAAEHIDFSEQVWQKLQEDKEEYFPDQEIVGWFFAQQGMAVESTELFMKVHLRHFGGEKVLMLMEPGEREDAFFRYDGGVMTKLGGYYIYYEKNSQMQTYMIQRNQGAGEKTSEKVEDKAVRNFRKIIDSKKPEERERGKTSVFSYAATICLAIAVLAVGANLYQSRQKSSEVSENSRETAAAVVEMTPVITITAAATEAVPVKTISPVPTQTRQKALTVSPTPASKKKAVQKSEKTEGDSTKAETKAEENRQKQPEKTEEPSRETSAAAGGGETYVIRPGDTLYQISLNRYGTVDAMEKICALNGISANEIIYPGQVIVLP